MTKIVVRLAGGLGNQLFQFFAALRASELFDVPYENIILDTRFLQNYESKHTFNIGFISSKFGITSVGRPQNLLLSLASRFRLGRILNNFFFKCIFTKDEKLILAKSGSSVKFVLLDGYFQSPKLLLTEQQRIQLRDQIFLEGASLIASCQKNLHTIGIHIRRGDYVSSKSAARIFKEISLDYYRAAIARLRRPDSLILVFSDDATLSEEFANEINALSVQSLRLSLENEFILFAACSDYVIANSTFSWWAAYIGHKDGCKIICPARWYRDSAQNERNLLLLPEFDLIDL